jgi:FkbM family methyltransferase
MGETIRKGIRTLQSQFPVLKDAKDAYYRHSRRLLRVPHESDFRALSLIPEALGGCYVDVGANHGQSIESILLFRPSAQIVSFEANPGLAEKLRRRYARRAGIRVEAVGLADRVDTFKLFVPSYNGFVYDGAASLDRVSAASWVSPRTVFGFDPAKLDIAEIECHVETLDGYRLDPIFIKIDVQGFEYQVLHGARQTLERCQPLLLVENFRSDERLVRLMGELGYEEFYHQDGTLRRGNSPRENSFLMTEARWASLAKDGAVR